MKATKGKKLAVLAMAMLAVIVGSIGRATKMVAHWVGKLVPMGMLRKFVPKWVCAQQMVFTLVVVAITVVGMRYTYTKPQIDTSIARSIDATEDEISVADFQTIDTTWEYEAECVAKVLYGMRNNSMDDLRGVVWVIINRCESQLYPNTIEGVCKQPSQWVGYADNNPIVEDLYDVAYEVVATWHNDGHRPFSPEFLWFNWSSKEIVFKTDFNEGKGCNYWHN